MSTWRPKNESLADIYGGPVFAWTWPFAALRAKMRFGWWPWILIVDMVVLFGSMIVGLTYDDVHVVSVVLGIFAGTVFFGSMFLMVVMVLTAPLAVRWMYAEQELVTRWAKARHAKVKRASRRLGGLIGMSVEDELGSPWPDDLGACPDAPILQRGHAFGFSTIVRAKDAFVVRVALTTHAAMLRTGRTRGGAGEVLAVCVPIKHGLCAGLSRVCCWRRTHATRLERILLAHLKEQWFESITMDERFVIGIGKGDDPVELFDLVNPAVLDRFVESDTVWEITPGWVTTYRRSRVTHPTQIDELVADARYLAEHVRKLTRHAA